jgi:hypothetical protein
MLYGWLQDEMDPVLTGRGCSYFGKVEDDWWDGEVWAATSARELGWSIVAVNGIFRTTHVCLAVWRWVMRGDEGLDDVAVA